MQFAIVRTLNLDNARTNHRIAWRGSFVRIRRRSSSTAEINVKFNDAQGEAYPLKNGEGFDGVPFQELFITNTAQAGEWVELVIAGDYDNPGPFQVLSSTEQTDAHITGQDSALTVKGAQGTDNYDMTVKGPNGGVLPVSINDTSTSFITKPKRVPWEVPSNQLAIADSTSSTTPVVLYTATASGYTIAAARVSQSALTAEGKLQVTDSGGTVVAELAAMGSNHNATVLGWRGMFIPSGYKIQLVTDGSGTVDCSIDGYVGGVNDVPVEAIE